MYAAGNRPDTPLEPKKPFAYGEAVMTVFGDETEDGVESRRVMRSGEGLK